MSGAEYFSDQFAINALMNSSAVVDKPRAIIEHSKVRQAMEDAGIQVVKVAAPNDLQDGIYTANWALVNNGLALMSRLPNKRKGEEAYALRYLKEVGLETRLLPENVQAFSGQGDALPCGNIVFVQSPYRTSIEAHPYIKSILGFDKLIALRTKPSRILRIGPAKRNKVTGWPDSPTYDLDLAIAVLKWPSKNHKGLIGWCPAVFKRSSSNLIRNLDAVDKIEVSKEEALKAYALNLVSTGETVIMNAGAPRFQAAIEKHGLKTITLDLPELKKGGGSIRCVTLTLEN